jgi:ADP-heptose:LPS heptosyltransferase
VIDLQAKTNVEECLDVLARMDYMIAADSGLLHCAMAMQIPAVAWFSSISASLRVDHYAGERRVIQKTKEELACTACGNYNFHGCKHGDATGDPDYKIPKFMAPCSDVKPEDFYAKIKEMNPASGGVTFKKNGDPYSWKKN